jgi:hypothetical protein
MGQSYFPGGDLPENSGHDWKLYDLERRKAAAEAERIAKGPDLLDKLSDINFIDPIWDGVAKVTKPFRTFVRVAFVPVLIFTLLFGVFHAPLFVAILIALGLGPFDLLRAAGLIGPKKKDKDGKDIDDPL